MFALWISAALAEGTAPCPPTDIGQADRHRQPAVLIVQTPGVAAHAYTDWADTLERHGLSAFLLQCPLEDRATAAALDSLGLQRGRAVGLIGHGFGGTLAAQAVEDGLRPSALGLIGAPLQAAPTALEDWLVHQPLPDTTLAPSAILSARWDETMVAPLLLGTPLPPLEPVGRDWLATLRAWGHGALSVDLRQSPVPVRALASGMDNIAPPERVRDRVPTGSFARLGYLSFQGEDPDHADLLVDTRAIRSLARWLRAQLR